MAVPAPDEGQKSGHDAKQGLSARGHRLPTVGAAVEIPPVYLPVLAVKGDGEFWFTKAPAEHWRRTRGPSPSRNPLTTPRPDTPWLRCGATAHRVVTQNMFSLRPPRQHSLLFTRDIFQNFLPATGLTPQHIPFLSSPQLDLAPIPDSPKTLSARLPSYCRLFVIVSRRPRWLQVPALPTFSVHWA